MAEYTDKKPLILAVDDDETTLMVLEKSIESFGYDVITAINGKQACDIINQEYKNIDTIVIDRLMPEMDGMEVVRWLKEKDKYSQIPVIMQTGEDSDEQIKEGIDAGVFYYLTKPINLPVLKSVMTAAIRESQSNKQLHTEMKHHGDSFQLMDNSKYTIRTVQDAQDVACFLANCFPNPDRTLTGLAELLTNAIEHGNLEISYNEKTALIEKGTWKEEIGKRESMDPYKSRIAEVFYKRTDDVHMVKIIDQGKGFNWKKYIKVDPERATDNHGRGIAQANMVSFDEIKYNAKGNEVIAIINMDGGEQELDW